MVLGDDSVYRVSTDTGKLEKLADSREHFSKLIDEGNNVHNWFMISLIDNLLSSEKHLKFGECYGYKQLPVVGGTYTLDNIAVMQLSEYYAFLEYFYEEIKDLPDSTNIQFKIT